MSFGRSERSPVSRAFTSGPVVSEGHGTESMMERKADAARSVSDDDRTGDPWPAREQKAPVRAKTAAAWIVLMRPDFEWRIADRRTGMRDSVARKGRKTGLERSAIRIPAVIPARKDVHSPAKILSLDISEVSQV